MNEIKININKVKITQSYNTKVPTATISYLDKIVSQVTQVNPSGTFSQLPSGNPGLALSFGNDKAVIPLTVQRPDGMSDNDFAIFAINLASSIICESGGNIEIKGSKINLNGDSDQAVLYTKLELQLQALMTAVNAALGTKLDGAGSPGSIAIDFSTAKSESVNIGE